MVILQLYDNHKYSRRIFFELGNFAEKLRILRIDY